MADKTTEIQYTDQELQEINRIISLVTGEDANFQQETPPVQKAPVLPVSDDIEDSEAFLPGDLEDIEDSSLSDEIGDLASLTGESLESPGGLDLFSDEDETSVFEDFPSEDTGTSETGETIFDQEIGGIDDDEIEDITGLIQDMDETEGEEITSLSDSDLSFIESEEEEPSGILDTLSFDEDKETGTLSDISDIEDLSFTDEGEKGKSTEFNIEQEDSENIPDLDELSLDDMTDIPEGDISDIPEIDLPDISDSIEIEGDTFSSEEGFDEGEEISSGFQEPMDDLDTLGELDSFDEDSFDDIEGLESEIDISKPVSTAADEIEDMDTLPDIDLDMGMGQEMEGFPDIDIASQEHGDLDETPLTIEPLDDGGDLDILEDSEDMGHEETSEPVDDQSEIELSDKELSKLKKAIILFNPAIRNEIKDTVLNDRLSPADTRRLVDMILTGKPEDNIHRFLEKRLKKKISLIDEAKISRKRIITARPEYTLEGRERQKKLLKLTKIFGISAIVTFALTIASYNYIYKPYMAKKLIHRGVEIIVNSGISGGRFQRRKNYDEAEKIFREVDEEYKKDYIYGYTEYARAYLSNGDYRESLEKLNRAYTIDRTNRDTLNSLGYFYAKTNRVYFDSVKNNLKEWYFRDSKEPVKIDSNLEMAINFYRRVLLLESDNITALLGIGNAYFYQGQYLKAKKYYEDILKVDKNSVIGYSGLLNLYIERDSMEMTASLHAELRRKKMLSELPSPLLSKLAGYYIDKNRDPNINVRIDYGVTSPRFKDPEDKTYPAILEVLKALNDRDPDYPQLQIQYARLSMDRQNFMVMERYLQKALSLAPNYYSALHLLGKYYYMTKEPVKAYEYLKKAVEYYPNQPVFTKEDFYRETESIGSTNRYMGNIFYYYFDKVKDRKGALDDEVAENETEKLANLAIAEQYYIKASNLGENSPELNYNLGRIYYLKKNYSVALDRWLQLYDDFIKSPELMLSLGNAFFHKGSYGAAKGELLKLVSVYEYEADRIKNPSKTRNSHIKIFQTLSSAYNNLGAVYQNLNEGEKRDLAYWKSVEFAKKIDRENEYARVNLARSHRDAQPLLDESIPFSIDYYSEEMRWGEK